MDSTHTRAATMRLPCLPLLVSLAAAAPLLVSLAAAAPLLPDQSCQLDPSSRALACACTRASLRLPALAVLLAEWPRATVDTLLISDCGSLDMNLSTAGLPHPLLQVRVSGVEYLTVRGVDLGPGQALDLHIAGVGKQANLLGSVACSTCNSSSAAPRLAVEVTDSSLLLLQSLTVHGVKLTLKTRNVAHVKMSHSNLGGLEGNSIEVFYSSKLEIKSSVFSSQDPEKEIIVLNHVENFHLDRVTGLSNASYSVLSDDTKLTMFCSPSPSAPWDSALCGPPPLLSRSPTAALPNPWLRSPGSGPVVTVVAALLLTASILALLGLHRRGKLDRLL